MVKKVGFSLSGLMDRPRRLWRDERGAVAIYVGLTSALMLGFGALVIDAGRLFTVNTELQNAADAAALAGAAELDGNTDALVRATAAAQGAFVSNLQNFYTSGAASREVDLANIRFFNGLPASDADPISAGLVTADPTLARFIEVTTQTRDVAYVLAPILTAVAGGGAGPASGTTNAVAVAGLNSVVCKVPPLMLCNPLEGINGPGAEFEAIVGQQVLIKAKGPGSQWVPGDFGLLDPPDGNSGAAVVAASIASGNTNGCYSAFVTLRTGQAQAPVQTALNTRFDMYENPQFGGAQDKKNPAYRPSLNVTKGKYKSANQWENYTAPTDGTGLPISACFDGTTRFCNPATTGTAATVFSQYFATNHPSYTLDQSLIDAIDSNDDGVVTTQEIYAWENANHIPMNTATDTTPSTSTRENGRPTNYDSGPSGVLPDAERRVIQAAVLNCLEHNITGASGGPYPVEAFLSMFLMKPSEDPSVGGIYVEVIRELVPGQDDELHDIVQLYR